MALPAVPHPHAAASAWPCSCGSGYGWALAAAPASGATGTNVLVVGSDSRAGLTEEEKSRWHAGGAACRCADVVMVVHLSAHGLRASVVSLPATPMSRSRRTTTARDPPPTLARSTPSCSTAVLTC